MLLLSLLLPFAAAAAPPADYVNTAISRTVELGGAIARVSTQFSVKALVDSPGAYHLALAGEGDAVPAFWEVTAGGKVLDVTLPTSDCSPSTVQIDLGRLKKDETTTIALLQLLAHTIEPLPKVIEQSDPQYLRWTTNSTYVDSWYLTDVERIKIRSPTANILSHGSVSSTYARDNTVTKASSTVTLGPFTSLPATLGGDVPRQPFNVHYETREPVVGLKTLKRSAEVSHWGGNLNIQDEMNLVNNGPKLKGHFNRLAHMQSRFHAASPAQIFKEFSLRLPASAHSAYYYDTIGNVSWSHFRPGTSSKRPKSRAVDSVLELKPRYPLLGGWNYSFTMGYDMPLEDVLKSDGSRKVLGVPFMTSWQDLLVEDAEMNIILPEGATNIEVFAPFPADISRWTHKTYLDSTGRPAITLRKSLCTENHAQTVYVTYTYSSGAQLQKPLTVAAVIGGLFILGFGLRRVDYSLDKKTA
ncbi:Ribophorin I [Kockovaella imperatae]|uniref:Dolichyl-diphosphooligosaccharide--protein glycosyltransferase subunit 1 n=1 Tax=Kockovaella imperatae TaxID=4999 RepID=A0A1Y1UMW4_9TREE|nr:Ribophorin I [Kockovaella imperatae]ORX38806.1 Ribophorin I [Kockovaella imperatae]